MTKTIKLILVCACFGLWGFVFWRMSLARLITGNTAMLDFDVYYHTAQDVRRGTHPFLLPYMQTGGPPSVIISYLPFSLVPLPTARSLMTIGNIGAIWIAGWVLASYKRHHERWFWTIVLSTGLLLPFPTRFNLGQGQPNLWIMAAVAYVLTRSQENTKSLLISLIILIKTNYSLLLLSLWKIKKVLVKTICLLVFFLSVASPIIKPQYYSDFIQLRLFQTTFSSTNNHDTDYYNQSLKAALNRVSLQIIYPYLFISVLILAIIYLSKHPENIGGGVLFSLLLSPLLWQHYVVVSYPTAFLSITNKATSWRIKAVTLLGLGLVSIELPWLHHQSLQFPNNLLASHFFFGLCCLLIAQFQNQKTTE